MRNGLCALALVLAAGCSGGDGDDAATTTETTVPAGPECGGWDIGDVHDDPPECWPAMLDHLAEREGLTLTGDAHEQAMSLCRRIDGGGYTGGALGALADWQTGAAPKPADDPSLFMVLAVAAYCPEHFDDMQASG